MEPLDPRLIYLPENEADKHSGHCEVLRDYWCLVHLEKGIILYQIEPKRKGSLVGARVQGNRDKTVSEYIRNSHYPWAIIKQIPLIIIPINVGDY